MSADIICHPWSEMDFMFSLDQVHESVVHPVLLCFNRFWTLNSIILVKLQVSSCR